MAETDSEEKSKSDVYRERNLLALAFIHELYLNTAVVAGWWPDTDDVNGEEWAVVWINLPADRGQVGWHVPREMVPYWLPRIDPEYDGYSTSEKNGRLREYARLVEDYS